MIKPVVEIYTKKDCIPCKYFSTNEKCSLCRDAKDIISRVNLEIPFEFKEVNIDDNEDLLRRFQEDVPTVFINRKKAFKFKVDEAEFRKKIRKEIIKVGLRKLWNKKKNLS